MHKRCIGPKQQAVNRCRRSVVPENYRSYIDLDAAAAPGELLTDKITQLSMTFLLCVSLVVLVAAILQPASAIAPGPSRTAAETMAAQRFCNSSDITKLECDWAGEAEDSRTAAGTFTGSLWMNPPKPPQVLESSRTYYQIASRVVSLACKPGKLTVRSVFKFLPGSTGCSRLLLDTDTLGSQGSLGGSTGSVTRCTLRIAGPDAGAANGTGPAAIQAAMSAPDNACQTCKTCATCPQDIGVWYSDSAVFSFSGCEGLAQRPRDSYTPTKPGVVINPGNKILLAALTVKPATG